MDSLRRNGIASNASSSIWKVEVATSSIQFKETKGLRLKQRSEGEVMRRDRNDGAGHRLLEKQRSCRWILWGVIRANLSSTRGEAARGDTRSQSNTHSIESEEVRYPWHPWYGRRVWIHEDLDKNGEGIRRCRSESDLNARLCSAKFLFPS
jgi:hypothetical protein